jgi:hypothetical protein
MNQLVAQSACHWLENGGTFTLCSCRLRHHLQLLPLQLPLALGARCCPLVAV